MPSLYQARNAHHKKGRWHIIQSLFFIFVFFLAFFFFLQSSFFNVREIRVTGNKRLTAAEVVNLTGLAEGINIFKANINQAGERVLLNPMVRQVEITRDYPAALVIMVEERQPLALLVDGGFVLVSEDGVYLSKEKNLASANLPIITGVPVGAAGPGQAIAGEQLKAAREYLCAMPIGMRAAVSEVNVWDMNNIRIYTIDGAEVRFGDEKRVEDKIRLYREVISQSYTNKIQYIDISYKGNPVIKFFQTPEEGVKGKK